MSIQLWNKPTSRNVGYFLDLGLYSEALEVAAERGAITATYLRQELRQRTRGLLFVEKQSKRVANDLVRELHEFGWLERANGAGQLLENVPYKLTPKGNEILKLPNNAIRRHLAIKMQSRYTIPGWFVYRLWQINPQGQGEVILPAPARGWRPEPRQWEQKEWTDELAFQVLEAAKMAQSACLGSFPIEDEIWVRTVCKIWKHLGTWKQKGKAEVSDKINNKGAAFSPRGRLAMAMRAASVELLFGTTPPGQYAQDIASNKSPIMPRTFRVWCPRLADLELIFYTDKHPYITGRLIFPTAVFRHEAPQPPFEKLDDIRNPLGEFLWIYQPGWDLKGRAFLQTLIQTHQLISRRTGTLYVSLLDVRDEVCRRLRLSATFFDEFLKRAFRESLRPEAPYSISLETDIREDQRSGSGLLRRPIWIEGVPHSLIAIGKASRVHQLIDGVQPSF